MFKTTAIDTLKQDKKCQACWYMILSTMSGSTTISHLVEPWVAIRSAGPPASREDNCTSHPQDLR